MFGGRPTALWSLPYPLIVSQVPTLVSETISSLHHLLGMQPRVVVEVCTNLATPVWSPVSTNTLTEGWSYFSDPQWRELSRPFLSRPLALNPGVVARTSGTQPIIKPKRKELYEQQIQ